MNNFPSNRRAETFAYDPAGNRLAHTDTGDNVTQSPVFEQYETNSLNQYTQITTGNAPSADDEDNLSADTQDTQATSSAPSAQTPDSSILSYDPNGNLIDDGTQRYTYDAQNRLTAVESATVKAVFTYDARNRCVLRQYYKPDKNGVMLPDEANSVVMTYDTQWNILVDRSLTGRQTANYIHGSATDEVLAQVRDSGQRFYPLADALNSTIALATQNGAKTAVWHYDAYGRPTGATGDYRYLYTGREWITPVGLSEHRNRYYNPSTGRWLSRDSKYFKDGSNLYAYGRNSPIDYSDPFGTTSCSGALLDAIMKNVETDGNGNYQLYTKNGVGLGLGPAFNNIVSDFIGYTQVKDGVLVAVVQAENWDIMEYAENMGYDNLFDLLYNSIVIHEETHIDFASNQNPLINENTYGGLLLPEGAILSTEESVRNGDEFAAYQAQINYLQGHLNSGRYDNGEELSDDEIETVKQAIQYLEDGKPPKP